MAHRIWGRRRTGERGKSWIGTSWRSGDIVFICIARTLCDTHAEWMMAGWMRAFCFYIILSHVPWYWQPRYLFKHSSPSYLLFLPSYVSAATTHISAFKAHGIFTPSPAQCWIKGAQMLKLPSSTFTDWDSRGIGWWREWKLYLLTSVCFLMPHYVVLAPYFKTTAYACMHVGYETVNIGESISSVVSICTCVEHINITTLHTHT